MKQVIDRAIENAFLADAAIEFAKMISEPAPDMQALRSLAADILLMARLPRKKASVAGLSVYERRCALLEKWNSGKLRDGSTSLFFDENGKRL
jgi:hypothetical protein